MDRRALVFESLSPQRRSAARLEEERLQAFAARLSVPITAETVALYLADAMQTDRSNGRRLRERLSLLDAVAVVDGGPSWGSDPIIRRFVRGMYRIAPRRGPTQNCLDPLYPELVHALVDAVLWRSHAQLRDAALLLLAHHGSLHAAQLSWLQWSDLQILKDSLLVRTKTPRGLPRQIEIGATHGPICPVAAVRRWSEVHERAVGPVFGRRHRCTIAKTLRELGYPASVAWSPNKESKRQTLESAHIRLMQLTPRQTRDRAILLLASAAYLTTHEAVVLTLGDVSSTDRGLELAIIGRRDSVLVSRYSRKEYCPVDAWNAWRRMRERVYAKDPTGPAFVAIEGQTSCAQAITPIMLNLMIDNATERAELVGHWGFMSLRQGAIRAAVRQGMPAHVLARRAGLECLISVEAHRLREELVRSSVAGSVGL